MGEVLRNAALFTLEIFAFLERMQKVVGGSDTVHGLGERDRVTGVSARDFNVAGPREVAQSFWESREGSHSITMTNKFPHQATTDIAGGAGNEADWSKIAGVTVITHVHIVA